MDTLRTSVNVDEPTQLGRLIRRSRRAHHITQRDLADGAGVSERFLVELENGRISTEFRKVLNLLNLMGIRLRIGHQPVHQYPDTIRKTRKSSRVTQRDLAGLLNVSLSTIQKIEGGKPGVSLEKLFTVCRGLSLPWQADVPAEIQTQASDT